MELIQYKSYNGDNLGLFLFPDLMADKAEEIFVAAEQHAKELEVLNPDQLGIEEVEDYLASRGIERTFVDKTVNSTYL